MSPDAPAITVNTVRLVLDATAAAILKQARYNAEYGSTDPGKTAIGIATAARTYVEAEAIFAGFDPTAPIGPAGPTPIDPATLTPGPQDIPQDVPQGDDPFHSE